MKLFDFTSMLKDLSDYYERKEPKPGTSELWFDRVKSIPTEAIPWIVKKITSESETFPKNLPGMVAALFFSWRETHPQKIAHGYVVECPDCEDGTIRAWKIGLNGRPYSYLFRCRRCQRDTTQGWPMATRTDLLAEGYEPEQKEKPEKPGSLKVLVDKVCNDVPF